MPRSRKNKAARQAAAKTAEAHYWRGETRAADMVTVGWLFTAIATALFILGSLGAWWFISQQDEPEERLLLGFGYLQLATLGTAAACFMLGLIAGRIRQRPAPVLIRRITTVVATLPWAIWLVFFAWPR